MPIDLNKYPPDWVEIRTRILERAQNKCEQCGVENHCIVNSYQQNGRAVWNEWYAPPGSKSKKVKVVLTIAHLDHDETNHDVKDERLAAMCQLCHLRYDKDEKSRRRKLKKRKMNLSFSEKINGQPSFFVQKILHGLYEMCAKDENLPFTPEDIINLANKYDHRLIAESRMGEIRYLDTVAPKIHTIREDKDNRWKVGNKIHFIINNRSPSRYQFAPIVLCFCVQKIEVNWFEITTRQGEEDRVIEIVIDKSIWGRSLLSKVNSHGFISELARNDGFNSAEDFCEYFKKGFSGKLIHWVLQKGYELPEGSQMWKNHSVEKLFDK